jgi:flagellar biosynthesis protein FlhF
MTQEVAPANTEKIRELLRQELEATIEEIKPIKLKENSPKVVALVGPTGVGKTTTLAKIAADFSLMKNKKVGLITADTYRIAAVDQLKTYSEIIDLPLEVVFTPQELETAVEEFQDRDLILIDTAGRSQNNEIHISELNGFLKKAAIDEVYLVLSCTTKVGDLKKAINVYRELQLDKLILTKADETDSLGIVFEAVNKAEKPISYITVGQDVPEDIESPQAEELVNNIVEGLEL